MTQPPTLRERIAPFWSLLSDTLNVFVPRICVVCRLDDATSDDLCALCRDELMRDAHEPFRAEDSAQYLPISPVTGTVLPVIAATPYSPGFSRAILAFKDHGRLGLGRFFRKLMTRTLQRLPELLGAEMDQEVIGGPAYRVVPIPTSAAGFRRRGYDPVKEILPNTATHPDLSTWFLTDNGLLQHRMRLMHRSAHAGQNRDHRRRQAHAKFRLAGVERRRNYPAPIVLVDDVLTTGSTLAAATTLLESHGFGVAAAIVLAAVTGEQ